MELAKNSATRLILASINVKREFLCQKKKKKISKNFADSLFIYRNFAFFKDNFMQTI